MVAIHTICSVPFSPALVYLNMTMIFQMINFLILLWLLKKFLYRPVLNMLDRRAAEIRAALDEVEENKEKSEQELERIRKEYEAAKRESYVVRDQARKIAEQEKERIVESGKAAYEEIVEKARKDIELELGRAKDDLRRRVGEIGVEIAQRILQSDLNEEQRNRATSEYLDAAEKL